MRIFPIYVFHISRITEKKKKKKLNESSKQWRFVILETNFHTNFVLVLFLFQRLKLYYISWGVIADVIA